jgi:hypothetical protein
MRAFRLAAILVAAVVGSGCLVNIEKTADPGPAFAKARTEAARVQGRPGPAGHLHVLVWDRAEGHLVQVSLPIWIVRKAAKDGDLDLDEASGAAGKVRPHLTLEQIEKAGLGTLVEVEEEDGDQVLVWLS